MDFDACAVRFFSNGEYMVVGGSNNKAVLWTKDGVQLAPVCQRDDWVWAVAPRPRQNYVAVGCNDGSVALYQLVFSTVHGLYQVPAGIGSGEAAAEGRPRPERGAVAPPPLCGHDHGPPRRAVTAHAGRRDQAAAALFRAGVRRARV